MRLVRQLPLENGLTVNIYNHNHRYFGDYHRVRVEITCEVPIRDEYFAAAGDLDQARKALGRTAVFRRSFEQMGVPTAELDSAVEKIVVNFRHNTLLYIASASFPAKLIRSELAKSSHTPIRTYRAR